MPSLKDIRKKISSTKNTQQITKAMKMVSAAKLRRAQNAIVNARPYAYKLHAMISHLARAGYTAQMLKTEGGEAKRVLMVVLTSDRGLCGSFNASITKYAEKFYKENKDKYEMIDFIFIGRRGGDYFKRRNVKILDTILNLALDIKYDLAAQLSVRLLDAYNKGGYDKVVLVYNEFKTAISQKVIAETLLPVEPLREDLLTEEERAEFKKAEYNKVFSFEPNPEAILNELLPKHFSIQVYRAMQESVASEHGARMTAMDNATRNAGQLIKKMTLTYNKLRQAAITRELVEIVSGAEALK